MAKSLFRNKEKKWIDGLSRGIPPEFPQEMLDAIEDAWSSLARSYMRGQLAPATLDTIEARLEEFETFHKIRGFSLLDAWEVIGTAPPFVLCIATRLIPTTEGFDKQLVARHECRMVGLFELEKGAGTVMIRPESFGDTISEMFSRQEVDFPESREFCRSYYVMASDEDALRRGVPKPVFDQLGTKDDLFIEIREQDMVVFWDAVAGEVSVVDACDFFTPIAAVLSRRSQSPYR